MIPAQDVQHAARSDSGRVAESTVGTAEASASIALRLGELDTLAQRPLHEHVGVFTDLHATLQASLSEIDRG